MNYYRRSKNIDVYNHRQYLKALHSYPNGEKSYYEYYATRWLAWYRRFYKLNHEIYRKKQIIYFLEEIKNIVYIKGV